MRKATVSGQKQALYLHAYPSSRDHVILRKSHTMRSRRRPLACVGHVLRSRCQYPEILQPLCDWERPLITPITLGPRCNMSCRLRACAQFSWRSSHQTMATGHGDGSRLRAAKAPADVERIYHGVGAAWRGKDDAWRGLRAEARRAHGQLGPVSCAGSGAFRNTSLQGLHVAST